jgi:hypothetical protein
MDLPICSILANRRQKLPLHHTPRPKSSYSHNSRTISCCPDRRPVYPYSTCMCNPEQSKRPNAHKFLSQFHCKRNSSSLDRRIGWVLGLHRSECRRSSCRCKGSCQVLGTVHWCPTSILRPNKLGFLGFLWRRIFRRGCFAWCHRSGDFSD